MASFRQYRAPAANDSALVDPSWDTLCHQLKKPATVADLRVGGQRLGELSEAGRRDLLGAAEAFTSRYSDLGVSPEGPLVVSGHQPELFHPGVWFKNFALDALAKASGGIGVHLLIDSDLCREVSIRVPAGSVASPRADSVAYDTAYAATPHEERRVRDAGVFDSFAARVVSAVEPLISEPMVTRLWDYARDAGASGDKSLGEVLSESRHRVEQSWGAETLELPFSQVADTESFRRFVAELVLRPEETALAYNAALAEYREAHRIRTTAQPLPDLLREASWCETPFWVWSTATPNRRALYVKREADKIQLSDRAGWLAEGPAAADDFVAWLAELRELGVKVRSRALATTLYCRLVLADLFLHGIGGAKYDQVTDHFSQRLLGVTPPPHATLTATLRLPIDHQSATESDRLALVKRMRDFRYHPEEFFGSDADASALEVIEQKRKWVARTDSEVRAERHTQITAANRTLFDLLAPQREQAERELRRVEGERRAAKLLDSREYSFCLFPADNIRERLTRLSEIPSHD